MTYTKHTWVDGKDGGTLIDAMKLNDMEQGIADAGIVPSWVVDGDGPLPDGGVKRDTSGGIYLAANQSNPVTLTDVDGEVGGDGITWFENGMEVTTDASTHHMTFRAGVLRIDDVAASVGDLGAAALLDVGTTAGTVAAGDDFRLVAGATALQPDGPQVWPTTSLEDINAAPNKYIGKVQGMQIFNTTTNMPVWATGPAAGDVWNNASGITAHTPV
jgi:hypothetical protein